MNRTTYIGRRDEDGAYVLVNEREALPPRNDLRNFSDGFEWGYAGSGPAQLAIALLAHHAGDKRAVEHYQAFKDEFVATLPKMRWTIGGGDIAAWIKDRELTTTTS
jgi:hypothetical protein